jgi:hypothetical protein
MVEFRSRHGSHVLELGRDEEKERQFIRAAITAAMELLWKSTPGGVATMYGNQVPFSTSLTTMYLF